MIRTDTWLALVMLALVAMRAEAAELETAKPQQMGMSAQLGSEIDKAVGQLVEQHKLSGAVVIVLRRGKIIHDHAYGWRDLADKQPMQRDSIFRIYSMTKAITTVAAMQLWEQGKFQLDDPVAKYLPELAKMQVYAGGEGESMKLVPPNRPVSVVDLMRHTSGITYGNRADTAIDRLYASAHLTSRDHDLQAMIKKLSTLPLKSQPGEQFDYSPSIDVLGRLVEVWSGEKLDDYFARHIFQPLDMHDTGFFVPAEKLARFVTNYAPADGTLKPIDRPADSPYRQSPALLSGGGGLVSTARDYARFVTMLTGHGKLGDSRLLKAKTVALMMQNHVPDVAMPIGVGEPRRPGVGFGLGFSVRVAEDPKSPASPLGECRWGGAASTHFWIWPKQEVAVVALQQQMPYTGLLQDTLQPIVLGAVEK